MAGQPVLKGIKDSWSLTSFMQKMGKPKLAHNLTNKETGETFSALMFPTQQGDRDFTMVAFSSNLGELAAKEIADRVNELQVVELESGNYYLCNQGNGAWEDIF